MSPLPVLDMASGMAVDPRILRSTEQRRQSPRGSRTSHHFSVRFFLKSVSRARNDPLGCVLLPQPVIPLPHLTGDAGRGCVMPAAPCFFVFVCVCGAS